MFRKSMRTRRRLIYSSRPFTRSGHMPAQNQLCWSASYTWDFRYKATRTSAVCLCFGICVKALANEDTLLRAHCCRHKCLPARAAFAADTNFVSETQKMFLILFRNILCPQQMFPQHSFCVPRVCAPKKHHEQQCVRNNVSSFASTFKATPILYHVIGPCKVSISEARSFFKLV